VRENWNVPKPRRQLNSVRRKRPRSRGWGFRGGSIWNVTGMVYNTGRLPLMPFGILHYRTGNGIMISQTQDLFGVQRFSQSDGSSV
jgi:hypothetical protein